MAKKLTNIPTNLTEYPNSFKRQGAFPLEAYEVFYSLEAAEQYAKGNNANAGNIGYVGQTLKVVDGDSVKTYVIKDEKGTLLSEVSDEKSNREEYDRRIAGVTKEYYNSNRIPENYSNSNENLSKRITKIEDISTICIDGQGVPDEVLLDEENTWNGEFDGYHWGGVI